MAYTGKLPDGYLHVVGDHYILQTASREGFVVLVAELMALGHNPTSAYRINDEHELEYWLSVFERLGLWLRMSSLPEKSVYGENHVACSDGPIRETG